MTWVGRLWRVLILLSLLLAFGVLFQIVPPFNFPVATVIEIKPGTPVAALAKQFKDQHLIRSDVLFSKFISSRGGQIVAGYYEFEKALSVRAVADRVATGTFAVNPVKVTLPEGWDNLQIASRLSELLPKFNAEVFLTRARDFQGELFPSTYFFPSQITADQVIAILRSQFEIEFAKLADEVESSGRLREEIINLAAIVEEEVANTTDREVVAGVLWKRYDAGHKLEVDVARETYDAVGFPERPIVNPGLDAIKAVLNASTTAYWFYLSDKDGVTHFAKTFEEHKKNIAKYLR